MKMIDTEQMDTIYILPTREDVPKIQMQTVHKNESEIIELTHQEALKLARALIQTVEDLIGG